MCTRQHASQHTRRLIRTSTWILTPTTRTPSCTFKRHLIHHALTPTPTLTYLPYVIDVHNCIPSFTSMLSSLLPSPLHRCSVCWCSNKRRRRGSTETTTRPYHNGAANLKRCTGEYRTDWGTARGLIWEWVVWISVWCAGLCGVYGYAVEYECDGRWQS